MYYFRGGIMPMMAMANVGMAAGMGASAGVGSGMMVEPEPVVRKEFPETWLWDELSFDDGFVHIYKLNLIVCFHRVMQIGHMFLKRCLMVFFLCIFHPVSYIKNRD